MYARSSARGTGSSRRGARKGKGTYRTDTTRALGMARAPRADLARLHRPRARRLLPAGMVEDLSAGLWLLHALSVRREVCNKHHETLRSLVRFTRLQWSALRIRPP